MAYISLDIDLDDFDFKEVLNHIEDVYRNGYHTDLLEKWSYSTFGLQEEPKSSINDKIKMDFIKENFDKLTIENLQSIIK
jgi:hypothetical protein